MNKIIVEFLRIKKGLTIVKPGDGEPYF